MQLWTTSFLVYEKTTSLREAVAKVFAPGKSGGSVSRRRPSGPGRRRPDRPAAACRPAWSPRPPGGCWTPARPRPPRAGRPTVPRRISVPKPCSPAPANSRRTVTPSRMPSGSAGGVHSTPSRSHTTVAVGASSSCPSADTKTTSSAPAACAYRWAAMLTAYEIALTPPSSHGAATVASATRPRLSVSTLTPSRRCRSCSADTGASSANAVGRPPSSTPRVTTSRSTPSPGRSQAPTRSATSSRQAPRSVAGRSSAAADRASRSRCGSRSSSSPVGRSRTDSKQPSPRSTPRSSARSCGVAGSTRPVPRMPRSLLTGRHPSPRRILGE